MQGRKKIRVSFDTNLWISYLISKQLNRIDTIFEHRNLKLVFSSDLMEEFVEVSSRPKFEKYFSKEEINKLLKLIYLYAEFVEVKSSVKVCQDPKDNFLLALSKDGELDYLVTGDADLLILKHFGKTKIVTYKEFESLDF